MPAATYSRSSKDRSDVSIDAQNRQLDEMAAARGIPIVARYADAVESGKDDDRPDFQRLLRDLKNPRRGWDTILVLDTARIARRRHLAIIFEESECKKAGVRVLYKSLPESDPITEMLLKSILQAMDEWHSLTLADVKRILAGIAEQMEAEPGILKEAISGIVDRVVLDPDSMEAIVTYKIADLRGVKLASPRRGELNPSFEHQSAVVIRHRRRA